MRPRENSQGVHRQCKGITCILWGHWAVKGECSCGRPGACGSAPGCPRPTQSQQLSVLPGRQEPGLGSLRRQRSPVLDPPLTLVYSPAPVAGCLGGPAARERHRLSCLPAAPLPHRWRPLRPQVQPARFELSRQPCSAPAPFPKRPAELSEAWLPGVDTNAVCRTQRGLVLFLQFLSLGLEALAGGR